MNDLILADRELEVGFIGQLDALLEGIERMDASHKASSSNVENPQRVDPVCQTPLTLAAI